MQQLLLNPLDDARWQAVTQQSAVYVEAFVDERATIGDARGNGQLLQIARHDRIARGKMIAQGRIADRILQRHRCSGGEGGIVRLAEHKRSSSARRHAHFSIAAKPCQRHIRAACTQHTAASLHRSIVQIVHEIA
ncbi:hypothetical protein AUC45_06350 [Erythrobacter sp. YT30]|nr:hypothetical protein AUC45_06350 [Erythrobacter sp. YT30]